VLTLLGESHRLSAISFQPKQEADGREPMACTLAQSHCNPLLEGILARLTGCVGYLSVTCSCAVVGALDFLGSLLSPCLQSYSFLLSFPSTWRDTSR
jgi:hypothetical protein